MKLKTAFLLAGGLIVCLVSLFLARTHLLTAKETQQSITPTDIIFQRRGESSKIDTDLFGLFGPQICTAYGDAFSPWNSFYEPNSFTYQYRIAIPADYAHDVVRVEIFDPDSMNSSENVATVVRTQSVQDPTLVNPTLGPVINKFCGIDGDSSQFQDAPCILPTDELNYLDTPLTLDQINPFWFMRVDENRGLGDPYLHGIGVCGSTGIYETGYNTSTLYELYYYQAGETPIRTNLATYTGQTDDPRDLYTGATTPGDHNTDLFWVSPGAENQGPDFDLLYGTNHVPVDLGSTLDSFEIDLTSDVPNIVVDEEMGIRYLNLDITAMSGSSENAFAIWAGPPDYALTEPANVNQRNVKLTNEPGSHDSGGVVVTAVNHVVITSIIDIPAARPIADVPADMRGGSIFVTSFDLDSGTEPPITFYFDNIPESTWSLTFGEPGEDDPDGVSTGTRCLPGACDKQWVDPAYEIVIPGLENCFNYDDNDEACVPFYGGTLMMRMESGLNDTSTWTVEETAVSQPDEVCSAHPIGVGTNIRSVTAPGNGANPYPEASEFDYPVTPPTYQSFVMHQSDLLLDANTAEGAIFKLNLTENADGFSWLVWNQLITPSDALLADSFNNYGNSMDYTNHGDAGIAHPSYGHVVRGYANPEDSSDVTLNFANLIPKTSAQLSSDITSGVVNTAVNDYINSGALLHLPVFDSVDSATNSIIFRRVAFFKIVGYGNAGQPDEWLLLEFVRWNEVCSFPPEIPLIPTPGVTLTPSTTPTSSPTATATVTVTPTATPTTAPPPPTVEEFGIYLPFVSKQ